VKALLKMGAENQMPMRLLEAVEAINEDQKKVLFAKIERYFDGNLSGRTIAVWGLAFKPNTDDMREAPSTMLIESLLKAGARVRTFDPVAIHEAQKLFAANPDLRFCEDVYETVEGADAIALVTEWNEFRLPNWERIKALVANPVIFDGRNIYDDIMLSKEGFRYFGIGQSHP